MHGILLESVGEVYRGSMSGQPGSVCCCSRLKEFMDGAGGPERFGLPLKRLCSIRTSFDRCNCTKVEANCCVPSAA